MDSLSDYIQPILNERSWSWAVIGLIYFIGGLTIHGWFLKPLVRRARELPRKYYQELKGAYLKRSFWWWLFFLISFLIVIGLWMNTRAFPISGNDALAALAALASFILSIIFRIGAYGTAALVTFKHATEKEKEF